MEIVELPENKYEKIYDKVKRHKHHVRSNNYVTMKYNEPLKRYYCKVKVIEYAPCKDASELKCVASPPDFTGGYIETNDVIGYIYLTSIRDDFTYVLYEEIERIWNLNKLTHEVTFEDKSNLTKLI